MTKKSDLVVDYHLLDESVNTLRKLHREFAGLDHQKDEANHIWGHWSMQRAMYHFYDNWEHYRKELLKNMADVEHKASAARKAFKKTDHKLAENDHKKGKN